MVASWNAKVFTQCQLWINLKSIKIVRNWGIILHSYSISQFRQILEPGISLKQLLLLFCRSFLVPANLFKMIIMWHYAFQLYCISQQLSREKFYSPAQTQSEEAQILFTFSLFWWGRQPPITSVDVIQVHLCPCKYQHRLWETFHAWSPSLPPVARPSNNIPGGEKILNGNSINFNFNPNLSSYLCIAQL